MAAQAREHEVREVLADAGAMLDDVGDGAGHGGHAWLVLEVLVQSVHQVGDGLGDRPTGNQRSRGVFVHDIDLLDQR